MARCSGLGIVKELKMSQWVIRSRNSYYKEMGSTTMGLRPVQPSGTSCLINT
nr:MAG TPA: hypothetical protein [Caudoviricetes sp.]